MENLPSIKQVGLFQLTRSLQEIDEKLDLVCRDGEIFELTKEEIETLFLQKVDGSAEYYDFLESREQQIENRISYFKELKKTTSLKKERFKQYLIMAMDNANIKKLSGDIREISIRSNPPSAEIINKDLIPCEYVEVEQTVNIKKTDILKDLKKGIEIPGTKLTQGRNLKIK